jgi:hypothetical protein
MNWKNAECCGFSFRHFTGFKKTARELKGMTDKEYIFFVGFAGYFIMLNQIVQPIHVFIIP